MSILQKLHYFGKQITVRSILRYPVKLYQLVMGVSNTHQDQLQIYQNNYIIDGGPDLTSYWLEALFQYLCKSEKGGGGGIRENPRVLELGCNVGRNLQAFAQRGHRSLWGVDISEAAIAQMSQRYPAVAQSATIVNQPLEEFLPTCTDEFDFVFTRAVLQHIHPDSSWIFEHIARICSGYLVTIEAEWTTYHSTHVWTRDYAAIFSSLGLEEIYRQPVLRDANVLELSDYRHVVRVFARV